MNDQTEIQTPKSLLPSLRDERDLLNGVNYVFNQDGTVNWRAMVNPSHLYPNKDHFARKNLQIPDAIEGLRDDQLLIKLAGIKELAKLRGFKRIAFTFPKLQSDYVVATCQIDWINNFESRIFEERDRDVWESLSTMDVANATTENTDGFGQKFLETIAANRAFVRTVRNYLGIHIVGEDEIAKGNGSKASAQVSDGAADVSPQGILAKKFAEGVGGDMVEFREWLRVLWKEETYRNEDAKNWNAWKDVPAKEARMLLKFIK